RPRSPGTAWSCRRRCARSARPARRRGYAPRRPRAEAGRPRAAKCRRSRACALFGRPRRAAQCRRAYPGKVGTDFPKRICATQEVLHQHRGTDHHHRRRSGGAGAAKRKESSMCLPGCQKTVQRALSRRGLLGGTVAAFAATAVAPETAPAAPRRFSRTVDLTHVMSPEFPTFFGVPGISMEKQFDLKKDGFNLNWWRLIEHAGTHLD